jgi:TrmH family RNA methyltransferase
MDLEFEIEGLDLVFELFLDIDHRLRRLEIERMDRLILSWLPDMPPAEIIQSRNNPLVRRLRSLKEKSDGLLCLIEGPKLLREALGAGVEIVEVAAGPRAERAASSQVLLVDLAARGVRVRTLADDIVDSLSETETSQGWLALARRPVFAQSALASPGKPLVVVAVGIQNPGNVGGLLRSAEAAGATFAYLAEGTADPLSWKALRGSMGSAFRLPHLRVEKAEATVQQLRAEGLQIVATVASGGEPYTRARFDRPTALVFGGEGPGLSEAMLRHADARVTIPLRPPVESLNVGVAAGILLFEAARQRQERR